MAKVELYSLVLDLNLSLLIKGQQVTEAFGVGAVPKIKINLSNLRIHQIDVILRLCDWLNISIFEVYFESNTKLIKNFRG